MGDWVMFSAPPATTTRSMPAAMLAEAVATTVNPVAHWRLRARPGVSGGRPAAMAA